MKQLFPFLFPPLLKRFRHLSWETGTVGRLTPGLGLGKPYSKLDSCIDDSDTTPPTLVAL